MPNTEQIAGAAEPSALGLPCRADIDDDDARRRKPHVRVNKNLLNRPLARDCRVRADWKFSKKRQRWWCNLPGTKYVRYRLPGDADLRLPDAFDIAVLFLILRKARVNRSRKVKFTSQNAMLRGIGRPVRVRYRRRLQQSLTLWSQLSIRWQEWYREAQWESRDDGSWSDRGFHSRPDRVKIKEAERLRLVLPPPIERLRSKSLEIVVAEAWHESGAFEARVDFPLPMRAAVQNLVLALLAHPKAERKLRSWCRTAGINHSKRNIRLPRIIAEVGKWFEQHKGKTVLLRKKNGMYSFIMVDPHLADDDRGATTPTLRVHNVPPEGSQRQP